MNNPIFIVYDDENLEHQSNGPSYDSYESAWTIEDSYEFNCLYETDID